MSRFLAPILLIACVAAPNAFAARAKKTVPAPASSTNEVVVTSPVEKSELRVSPHETYVDSSSVGLRASYWDTSLAETGKASAPLYSVTGRFPVVETALGVISLDAGGAYGRFSRDVSLTAGIHQTQGTQTVHWIGLVVGPHLDVTPLLPALASAGMTLGAAVSLLPGYATASDSLAGPSLSRFEAPVMPSLDFGWYPARSFPIAVELQAFATAGLTGGLSGYGAGAGLRYCPQRGEL